MKISEQGNLNIRCIIQNEWTLCWMLNLDVGDARRKFFFKSLIILMCYMTTKVTNDSVIKKIIFDNNLQKNSSLSMDGFSLTLFLYFCSIFRIPLIRMSCGYILPLNIRQARIFLHYSAFAFNPADFLLMVLASCVEKKICDRRKYQIANAFPTLQKMNK